jgi:hypothetical protein
MAGNSAVHGCRLMDLTGEKLITLLIGVDFLIAIPLVLYADYVKLPELEKYFEGNEIVQLNKVRWPSKLPMHRAFRMGQISNFLSLSRRYIRLGDVTEEEVASVPLSLKRWATWPYYFLYQMFMCMGLHYVLYKL